jgi:thiol-disulfide isomerase/thioredoxin
MAIKRRTWIRALLAVALAALAAAAFIRPSERSERSNAWAPPVLRTSPDGFILVEARELLALIKHSRARGIVVNAWASWCGSCKEEIPVLFEIERKFNGSIEVVLVSVDEPEARPTAIAMLRDFGAPVPSFVVDGSLEVFKRTMNPRWTGAIPASFLFDHRPKLVYFWGGTVYENEMTPLLTRYLGGEHVEGEANFALAPGIVTK